MILLKINRQSERPVHQQIIRQIAHLVDRGALVAGNRLPSSRLMAEQLQVNRTTVYRAYGELASLGYISSTPGSYTVVRHRPKAMHEVVDRPPPVINWDEIASPGSRAMDEAMTLMRPERAADLAKAINFSRLELDPRLFPAAEFQRCLSHVMSSDGPELLSYGDSAGYQPLRECIAERMQMQGAAIAADEILITNGAQQALDLILRLLTTPESSVAVESPTYAHMIPLLKYYGVRALEIPMRADGMDLNRLAACLRQERPAFLYTMPTFHNPMGVSTSQQHRERLLGR